MKYNWAALRNCGLIAAATLWLGMSQASAQSVTFDFQDGTDQGWGHKFSNDASETFPIVNIGGSNRMEVLRNGDFQEAERASQGTDAFLNALNAATANPSGYLISYDWYVDTSLSPGNYGTYLQLGTYLNAGSGANAQDFPGTGKDVELNGTQLASGQVFSGTVSETLTAKYGALDPGFLAQTFLRLGLIINGDGSQAKVYFDNVSIRPVPEPASFALLGVGAFGVAGGVIRRRRK
jgi:PEP-CTERM motif